MSLLRQNNLLNDADVLINPATEDKQDNIIINQGLILSELGLKADLTETQPVSVASLPLPTGAATAANQTSGGQLTMDYGLAVAMGLISGKTAVNKFGAAPSGVQTTPTDIWARADSVPTQQIWLAPTASRIHTIQSDSASDTTGGVGVNTVVVSYLADWNTAEQSETVTGNLNAGIAMSASAVMINRMECIPQATTTTVGLNVGTITATAATDGTITAVISPGDGQTEQAIYGVPSTQNFYMKSWFASIDKSSVAAATCDFQIRVNVNPNVQTVAFTRKHDVSPQSTGTNNIQRTFDPPLKFAGPCIIKVQAIASAADIDGESSFGGYLVTN